MNLAVLMGRLVKDPELRHTQSGTAVVSFRIAVDRRFSAKEGGEREADFIDIVAWRHTAEFVSKYFQKGSMCAVHGRIQVREWQDKDGTRRWSTEVVAEQVYFTGSKRDSGSGGGGGYNTFDDRDAPPIEAQSNHGGFAELGEDDGELPF